MGVLHRNCSSLKTELIGYASDLTSVVVSQQHFSLHLSQQSQQCTMIDFPMLIEATSSHGVGRINKEGSDIGYQLYDVDKRRQPPRPVKPKEPAAIPEEGPRP